jgi:hypothetical protein
VGAATLPRMLAPYRLRILGSLVVLFTVTGCAGPPKGPAFEWASEPAANRGRVYVYRADSRTSLAIVKTTIDGREIGTFRDGDYDTIELASGSHKIRTGMRGLAFFSLGWNEHTFRIEPGETRFLHLEIRVDAGAPSTVAPSRALEIGGRSDLRASENVFIGERTRADAAPALEQSRRVFRDN